MTTTVKPALLELAELRKARNAIDNQIAAVIQRPASIGHIGEFIASRVFDIALEDSAVNKGHDGRFTTGPLAGKTVNVKFYGKLEFILDMNPNGIPDYYLVLTGPKGDSPTSRGAVRPLVIAQAFLFESEPLLEVLRGRGVRLGEATSVIRGLLGPAEIFPVQRSETLVLSEEQRGMLGIFQAESALPA